MVFSIVFALLGCYSIFLGVKTLLTGTLSAKEEAEVANYSQKGARTYKLTYSITNIIGGLIVVGVGVIKFLESQKILTDSLPFLIGGLALAIIMAVILIIVKKKCKDMPDD